MRLMRLLTIAITVVPTLLLGGCFFCGERFEYETAPCRVITARDYRVLRVVDGDTFKIEYDGIETSVRLALVDAPERDEPGGPEATAALRQLIDGRTVIIAFTDPDGRKRDNWGRLLCSVKVAGVDVETELVRLGLAEWRK